MRLPLTSLTVALVLAYAPVSRAQAGMPVGDVRDEDFVSASSLPLAPGSRVLDQGRIFTDEEEAALATELAGFGDAHGINVFVAGYSFLLGETVNDRIQRLVQAWDDPDDSRDTIVVLYTRANESLAIAGGTTIPKRLSTMDFNACTKAGIEAAKSIGDLAEGGGPDHAARIRAATTALLGAVGYELEHQTFLERLHRRGFILFGAGFLGVLCLGAGIWLLARKHFENRQRAERRFYYFPTLPVGERFGAPFGGGNAYVLDCRAAASPEKPRKQETASGIARAAL